MRRKNDTRPAWATHGRWGQEGQRGGSRSVGHDWRDRDARVRWTSLAGYAALDMVVH